MNGWPYLMKECSLSLTNTADNEIGSERERLRYRKCSGQTKIKQTFSPGHK